MKKAASAVVLGLAAACVLTGIVNAQKTDEQKKSQVSQSIVGEQATVDTRTDTEEYRDPMLPELDLSVQVAPGTRIAVVSKSTSGQFWDLVRKGMQAAVEEVNEAYGFSKEEQVSIRFEGPSNESDVETQINTLDAVIAENPDIVCLAAGDMNSCQAQLETAGENGIPVVVFDSNVLETELVSAYRGTDNRMAGEIAARKMVEALGGEGRVAVFSIQKKTLSAVERTEGFMDVLAEYPKMEVSWVVYQDQVEEDLGTLMAQILDGEQVPDGVFCTNADVAEIYLGLEQDPEKKQPVLIGMDATTTQQEAVRDGRELGIVSQHPYAMGYETVLTGLLCADEEKSAEVLKEKLLTPMWIGLSDLEDPSCGGYLYN